jgi:hypothetical protein
MPQNEVASAPLRAPAGAANSFASRFAPAEKMPAVSGRVESVSAFADSASSGGMMNGRGLY